MKIPKQENFKFKNSKKIKDVQYLALEGGGGKGNAYLGALQALEKLNKLPMSPMNREENGETVIKGIAGASAGAITAFLLVLGCNSKDIKEVMTEYDFNDFYEKPKPGVYKCVKNRNKEGKNKFFLASDGISRVPKTITTSVDNETGRLFIVRNQALKVIHGHQLHDNIDIATVKGQANINSLKRRAFHKRFLISFLAKTIFNSSINSFLLGSLRAISNKLIGKLIVDYIEDRPNTNKALLQQFRDFVKKVACIPCDEKASFEQIAASQGVKFGEAQLFDKLIKNPFWSLYGGFIKPSTKTQVFKFNFFKIIGNKYVDAYIDCVKYDRALYTGIEVRNFFTSVLIEFLIKNFKVRIIPDQCADTFIMPPDGNFDIENETHEKYKWLTKSAARALENQENNTDFKEVWFLSEVINMTFLEFENITKNTLRLTTSNLSKGIPCIFSSESTPDFPVIDATCMSMSIPFTFKPTFVDTTVMVNMGATDKNPFGLVNDSEDYHGFHGDGGMFNNLPIHLFDEINPVTKYAQLNDKIMGIRLSDKYPRDKYPETKEDLNGQKLGYLNDPLYKKYLFDKYRYQSKKKNNDSSNDNDTKKSKFITTNRYSKDVAVQYYNGSLGMISEFLSDMADGGIYYQGEEGQFRFEAERRQVLELFCYPVGLFNFAPSVQDEINIEAFKFVQARALLKTSAWIGLEFDEIEEELKEYYKTEFKNDNDWDRNIKPLLKDFYASCKQ